MATAEVSAISGIPEATLRYWATQTDDEGPPSFKIGRRRCYRRSAVVAWIDAQERATTNRPQAND
ncbi:MAG: helix-turn-helix domain-containing protein [Mycobacterium pseudokansasii]|nr:helix-turn-helix domain-containing protein [Mycobacterium pseudokansasii]MBY0388954.1 helix-turn-helix domain-containing protein [Mycobacterium pseudokansasii]